MTAAELFHPADTNRPARVLVIAELGVNHDGHLSRALDLVAIAAAAGADAVKLQLFDAQRLLSNQAVLAHYQQQAGATDPRSLLSRLQLSFHDMVQVAAAARDAGLRFILTPFSLADLDDLARLNVDAVKIASPDAVNHPLLEAAARLGKPLLISTGTCELSELDFAADLLRRHPPGGALLQCVSSYPAAPADAAIAGLMVLHQRFGLPVGYSDHTTELISGALAVAAGACVVEKHLTYNRQASGPDHAASLDPVGFTHYVQLIRQAQEMLGPLQKRCLPCEQDVRLASRQAVCAQRDLPAGHILTREDLTIKRPCPPDALPAAELPRLIGRRLARAVAANNLLRRDDLAPN